MSRRDWRCVIAIFGLVGFCLSTALADTPKFQGVHQPVLVVKRQGAHIGNHRQHQSDVAPLPVRVVDDPLTAQHAKDREVKSDRHDADGLKAEVRAANAAEQQAWAAWATFAATAIGMFFLVWTLAEERRANKIAQDQFLLQSRPWVKIKPIACKEVVFDGGKIKVTVNFEIQCIGDNPARDIFVNFRGFTARGYLVVEEGIREAIDDALKKFTPIASKSGDVLSPNETREVGVAAFAAPHIPSEIKNEKEIARRSAAGEPPMKTDLDISIAYFVLYRSFTSDEWLYMGEVAVISRVDNKTWPDTDEVFAANSVRGGVFGGRIMN